MAYCRVRSIGAPIEDRKSTTSRNRSASSTADGVSDQCHARLEQQGALPRRRSPGPGDSRPAVGASPTSRCPCAWPPRRCRRAGGPAGEGCSTTGAGRARRARGSPRPQTSANFVGARVERAHHDVLALAPKGSSTAVSACSATVRLLPACRGSTAGTGTARRPRPAARPPWRAEHRAPRYGEQLDRCAAYRCGPDRPTRAADGAAPLRVRLRYYDGARGAVDQGAGCLRRSSRRPPYRPHRGWRAGGR